MEGPLLDAEAIVTALARMLTPDTRNILLAFITPYNLSSCCLGLPLAYRGIATELDLAV